VTIIAKFGSRCPACGNPIRPGDHVEWTHGQKAVHTTCPEAAQPALLPARIAVEDAGIYVLPDGSIVKVKSNREKTRTYAKRWTVSGANRVNADGETVHGEFVYESGLIQQVAATGRKMTLEEARAFTLQYGECVRCGRHLTDPKSLDRAMGPVCIKYFAGGVGAGVYELPAGMVEFESENAC
jgi:hypothetical protein